MTFTFPELLHVDGVVYHLYRYPLEDYLATLPSRPRLPKRPWNTNGYMATWSVEGGVLYLTELSAPVADLVTQLFPGARGPVPCFWLDGMLVGYRGDRRHVGYPSRRIFHHEIYLEVSAGKVTRQWLLDLTSVPDQTDDELRLDLPRFLWPARLRDGADQDDNADAS